MALDKQQLEEFKKLLNDRTKELNADLSDFAKKDTKADDNYVSEFPDYGEKEDENAREVAEYSERLSLESTFESELRDVKDALKRIEDGTYGICKYCGKEIGIARLKIRPTSSACVECKKKFKGEL